MRNGTKYQSVSKAQATMGIDSLVLRDATEKQRKHAKFTGKAHDNHKVYGFTLKGFFSLRGK